MAEYIDKKQLDRKFIIEMLAPNTITIFDAKDIIDGLPIADVIERSKIAKAIDEIDFLRQHRAKYITEDNKICIDSGEVLKILKEI